MRQRILLGILLALSCRVDAHPGFSAVLHDLHGYVARQNASTDGPSTTLLADLATHGAKTPAGEAIRSILQGESTAVVDPTVVYTRPDAVNKAGNGGLNSPACGTDTCCIWSYIVPAMVVAFSENNGTRCSALARSAIRIGFHDAAV
ncbi:hypothetical protein SPBR_03328 [Sporothrix brasiliensis 5110]|uniref:Uncharacterized protein n=1 Tax=Sporothrix brasiliensis 5110 TaxID=1398154 RepID=A0A0C2IZC8_9PEZI|nr:uncharacterized protein SPBR_03328 [Sporothrix brasiliensis 5110]KIH92080.1 hypothetical protein SPBR_03328 [Sporothrix brasiliensis 5110]